MSQNNKISYITNCPYKYRMNECIVNDCNVKSKYKFNSL